MVSTQDSESCDPSSNLGGTFTFYARAAQHLKIIFVMKLH